MRSSPYVLAPTEILIDKVVMSSGVSKRLFTSVLNKKGTGHTEPQTRQKVPNFPIELFPPLVMHHSRRSSKLDTGLKASPTENKTVWI